MPPTSLTSAPPFKIYLEDHKADNTNEKIREEVKSIGSGNQKIKEYYTSYTSFHYQGSIDYLSTWSGRPTASATATSANALASAGEPKATSAGSACKKARVRNTLLLLSSFLLALLYLSCNFRRLGPFRVEN